MLLLHPWFGWNQIAAKISSLVIIFARFGKPLVCFQYLCVEIGTLRHVFEATTTEKEVTFEEALNVKLEVMCLKNELCQTQT
jgi:hypothetical protein